MRLKLAAILSTLVTAVFIATPSTSSGQTAREVLEKARKGEKIDSPPKKEAAPQAATPRDRRSAIREKARKEQKKDAASSAAAPKDNEGRAFLKKKGKGKGFAKGQDK